MRAALYTFPFVCAARRESRRERGQEPISICMAQYLVCYVGVENFAFDNEPAFLPVSLASLTSAEVPTDGSSLS